MRIQYFPSHEAILKTYFHFLFKILFQTCCLLFFLCYFLVDMKCQEINPPFKRSKHIKIKKTLFSWYESETHDLWLQENVVFFFTKRKISRITQNKWKNKNNKNLRINSCHLQVQRAYIQKLEMLFCMYV